ncbi:MAG: glycosyltransferase family 4 protein [Bilophila wadsworthia]
MADAVVATNSVMARHFAEKMRVPAERLHMILGGVDTELFRFDPEGRAEVRARYGFTDDECVVGLLGRFDLVKGQRETIAALAKLVGEGVRNIRLLLLGFSTATLQEEVEAWIREAGMERYVTITGKVPDVTACLSALDVGVVASLWSETIARAALEIMACGRPLVSLRWGHAGSASASALVRRGCGRAGWRAAARRRMGAAQACGHCSSGLSLRTGFSQQTLAVYELVPSAVFPGPFNFGMVPLSRQSAPRNAADRDSTNTKVFEGKGVRGEEKCGRCSPILQKVSPPLPNASMPFQSSSA